jgi:hypothetical protein
MEEWMQTQQHYQGQPGGRNRSYSMSHADNFSSFYHQLQQQQHRPQQAFPQQPPHHQHQSAVAMMTDSFLQEGSPLSMSSSCGSDDAAYSSDYAPQSMGAPLQQHQQQLAFEHPPPAMPAHLQRRASLSSAPVAGGVGTSLGILGGFVGEGLRAEYASRRPGGRRKSICLSPPQQPGGQEDASHMNLAEPRQQHQQQQPTSYTSVPDSEVASESAAAMEAMRRNSLYVQTPNLPLSIIVII